MIGTLLRIGFINIRRDRVVQALTFLLPIMFFSIFAMVFGNQRNRQSPVYVPVADEDRTEYSRKFVKALAAEGSLRVETTKENEPNVELTADVVRELVRGGQYAVAVVIPKGFTAGNRLFERDASAPKIQVLADVSDPIAPQIVMGMLQKVSFTAAPSIIATQGMSMFEKYGGALTPQQKASMETWKKQIDQEEAKGTTADAANPTVGMPIELVNVLRPNGDGQPTVSFYAAGIGVMFLLFSCTGAGGAMLDEEESGTLGRLIGSRAGMTGVLAGKWLFLVIMGIIQLTVMFVWGALMFGLPLWSHLPGFFVMTVVTACAASAFGLVLATLSRSRAQLSGLSTIVILAMSAVGGSMFPRFLMTEGMQKMGLVTFNAWALDGYIKVFWREAPIIDLWPQVLVLAALCAVFLTGARFFARRWETL